MASASPPPPDYVRTNLRFIIPPMDGSVPFTHVNTAADGTRKQNFSHEPREVEVENIRGKEGDYTIDNAGFQFFRRPTAIMDLTYDEKVKEAYYAECEVVLKELTGASKVIFYDYTIRRRRPGQASQGKNTRQPVTHVHVDNTPGRAESLVFKHAPTEAADLLTKRYQTLSLWRPISNPMLDWPLALCDYRSVDVEKDAIAVSLLFPDEEPGEIYNFQYNPAQKWKYLRGMEKDEGVLIKFFDSVRDGSVALLAPHTGFEDPTTPADAPLRESIEVRALVFYD